MAPERIRLGLLQNGLHSLHHAVEHLGLALAAADDKSSTAYDPTDNSVRRPEACGSPSWYVGGTYIKLPPVYGIKFCTLHLIHGLELLVKAYLERAVPGSTSESGRPGRSISMRAAALRLAESRPGLLDPEHLELVLQASAIRNAIEHSELDATWPEMRRLAVDFLAVCNYLAFALHGIALADEFGFDPYREGEDPVGAVVSDVLGDRSPISEELVRRLASDWAKRNPSERLVHCLHCGARGVSLASDRCVACGALGGADVGQLCEELEETTRRLFDVKERFPSGGDAD